MLCQSSGQQWYAEYIHGKNHQINKFSKESQLNCARLREVKDTSNKLSKKPTIKKREV